MKKVLFTLILSIFAIPVAFADTVSLGDYYDGFDDAITFYNNNQSLINQAISLWETNYSTSYPYYYITYHTNSNGFVLNYYSSSSMIQYFDEIISPYDDCSGDFCYGQIYADNGSATLSEIFATATGSRIYSPYYNNTSIDYYPLYNNNMTYNSSNELAIPAFSSSTFDFQSQYFTVSENDVLPSYLTLYQGSFTPSPNYVEINLNNYSYVALSLKNYNVSTAFDTTFLVKGQLCATPVYDYGMTEKSNYSSAGYQVQSCSAAYSNFTPYQFYILESDIKYHSIYYLKAYNTSIENKVKVDTNVFDISYISSQNASSPQVVVNGRSYPTIPYDNLSSNATISTENGYISGQVKNVFDVSEDSSFISSLFENPLSALTTVWTAILSMFALIGSFIGILPYTMQAFLYASFGLGIALGIIKILIGG